MRELAEQVGGCSTKIGIELKVGVRIVDDELERVVVVDQWKKREGEERMQMAMQSVEATADADAVVEGVVVVAAGAVVEVDKSTATVISYL